MKNGPLYTLALIYDIVEQFSYLVTQREFLTLHFVAVSC